MNPGSFLESSETTGSTHVAVGGGVCVQEVNRLPVRREDVEGRRLLARLEGLLHWDGQRGAVEQLLVLNGGAPESLPHGDVLKRH